jgi:hypothetical protein
VVNQDEYLNNSFNPYNHDPFGALDYLKPTVCEDKSFHRLRCCEWTNNRFTRRGSHPIPLNTDGENSNKNEKRENYYVQ